VPIDDVKLPITDVGASRSFYIASLAPFGYSWSTTRSPSSASAPATAATTTSRSASWPVLRRASVRTSRSRRRPRPTAATAAGGRDNGPPGERPYGGYYYAAFVLDPDGHNIEAVYHGR
jgi:hypothetical protein